MSAPAARRARSAHRAQGARKGHPFQLGWLWRWVVLVVGIGAWQLWASGHHSPFFPPPSAIVARMYHLWFSGPASHLFLTANATGNVLPSI